MTRTPLIHWLLIISGFVGIFVLQHVGRFAYINHWEFEPAVEEFNKAYENHDRAAMDAALQKELRAHQRGKDWLWFLHRAQ